MTCQSRLLECASLLPWQRRKTTQMWTLAPVIKSRSNIGLISADKENCHDVVAWQDGLSICHVTLATLVSRSGSYCRNTNAVSLKITNVSRPIYGIKLWAFQFLCPHSYALFSGQFVGVKIALNSQFYPTRNG